MVMRSARLEQIFGGPLDTLNTGQVRSLVAGSVTEAFDLDFKAMLYGRTEADKRSLAVDVAALANTAGGAIVLGIGENEQARASTAPGVALSDDEERRMRQVVASLVAPVPTFDIFPVADTTTTGFYLLVVTRSAGAPHAVIVGEGLRYPKRNGATTRYLSEPEVAEAYRLRLAGLRAQEDRLSTVSMNGTEHLDVTDAVWACVALVPDVPGDSQLNGTTYAEFNRRAHAGSATIVPTGVQVQRTSVGPGRLSADGGAEATGASLSSWVAYDLFTDGAGFFAHFIGRQGAGGEYVLADDEYLTIAVLSGLMLLGQHARDSTAAGGGTILQAEVNAGKTPVVLGHSRGFRNTYGGALPHVPAARTAAPSLDVLATPGPGLVAVGARLCHVLGQGFGIPELGQLTTDGQIRGKYFMQERRAALETWAAQCGVAVTDDVVR